MYTAKTRLKVAQICFLISIFIVRNSSSIRENYIYVSMDFVIYFQVTYKLSFFKEFFAFFLFLSLLLFYPIKWDELQFIRPNRRYWSGIPNWNWHIDSTACPSFIKSAIKDTSPLCSFRPFFVVCPEKSHLMDSLTISFQLGGKRRNSM